MAGISARDLSFPGPFPFTRGIQPTMYRGRLWTMRQYAGFGTAAESNRRYRYLLAQGVSGLSVAFDLPTQMGYDSDHPLAAGEVGRVGVAIDSLDDMAALFDGIPLDQRVDVDDDQRDGDHPAGALRRRRAAAGRADRARSSGTVQNDILKEYVARGTYIYPPRAVAADRHRHLRVSASASCRNWNTISISGYHIREAGSTAVQEVAFTFAQRASPTCRRRVDAGLDVNRFGQRLSFFFNAHNDFLEEIAKFRAARRLWARIMRDRFGATNPRAQQLRFHTQTAGSTLTAQQPDNNIVRVALQALAAVLGGTQSLHCNGRDEALALPTEESARIALRTQQIIAAESGVANTVDPVGGAYAIEEATERIERERDGAARARSTRPAARWRRSSGPDPARDPGVGLPRAAGDRRRRQRRRRREPVHDRASRRRSRRCRSIPTIERAPGRARARRARVARRRPRGERRSTRVDGRGATAPTTWCRRSSPPSRRDATRRRDLRRAARACSASTRRSMLTIGSIADRGSTEPTPRSDSDPDPISLLASST